MQGDGAEDEHPSAANLQSVDNVFWIVWSPEADVPPKVKYTKKSQAVHVAEAMAKKYPNQHWHVLECVGTVEGYVRDERD